MSLIACQHCGKSIAENADVCPGCGGKVDDAYRQMMIHRLKVIKYIIGGFVGALLLFGIAACLFGRASDEELKRREEQRKAQEIEDMIKGFRP